jgi:tetratricopeptide (TPR) repeat protein
MTSVLPQILSKWYVRLLRVIRKGRLVTRKELEGKYAMNGRKEALERAHQYWEQKDFQEAYELYEQLLRDAPNDAVILREYARAKYVQYDDLEYAAQLFERAVALEPDASIAALLCLGELNSCGYGKGYQAAFGVYQRVLELDPHNADAYIGIGMLHRRPTLSCTLKERIEAFRTATQIAPQRVDVHMNLAMALIEAEDRENALKELKIAEELSVQSGDHQFAQTIRAKRQKLENNRPITSFAYGNYDQMDWDF